MPTPTLVRKSFTALETKVLTEYKGQPVEGYVETVFSVTGNKDRQADIIVPGAFTDAMANSRLPTVVYGHQWDNLDAVLGKTVEWGELAPGDARLPDRLMKGGRGGMKAVVKFDLETPSGRIGFTHVKNGNLLEWSFAFDVPDGGSEYDAKAGVRRITKINEVYEVSLVLIGANPETATMGYKAFSPAELADTQSERAKALVDEAGEILDAAKAHLLAPETKDVPELTGDEAQHMEPLTAALDAIKLLMTQELAEDDAEYDCVIRLACIAQSLVDWANDEANEYDSDDYAMMAAEPDDTETKSEEAEASEDEGDDFPFWMVAAVHAALNPEFPKSSPVSADIELSEDDEPVGLMRLLPGPTPRQRRGTAAS